MQALTLDDIRHKAPSVFAEQPWGEVSDNYRMFPTSQIVTKMIANGFTPVQAMQTKPRKEDRTPFAKHVIRFRQYGQVENPTGTEVPEIVLLNSHDGRSSYKLMLGFWRIVCSNGLIVASSMVDEVRVRHSGKESLIDDVIEGSYKLIEEAPKAIEQINNWKSLILDTREQTAFASSALELRDSALKISASTILEPRRDADDFLSGGSRDLYTTMNVVQENLIRGGRTVEGKDSKGRTRALRAIRGVDTDTKLNRSLWTLAEKMAELKAA